MIEADIDWDRVTIRQPGTSPILISRAASVTIRDWLDFWQVSDEAIREALEAAEEKGYEDGRRDFGGESDAL